MPVKSIRPVIYLACAAAFVVISAAIVLDVCNWNSLRPDLNRKISASIGHDFAIHGDLKVQLVPEFPAGSFLERYILHCPLIQISANDIAVSNAPWSHAGAELATAQKIVILLRPWPLLRHQVQITELNLQLPQIALERGADGHDNWSLPNSGVSNWTTKIERLRFADGSMRFLDETIGLDLHAMANSVATVPVKTPAQHGQTALQFDLSFNLGGTYRHDAIKGNGKLGSILSPDNASTVFPVSADMQIGPNSISFNGVITDPRAPSGINLELALAGASLSELSPLTGVLLPVTAPYQIRGNLLGQKIGANWTWHYQNFAGKMGASDLAGSLEYVHGLPRSTLSGAVTSNQLSLGDLAPTIGADTNIQKIARNQQPVQPTIKTLPVEQFHTEKWGTLDADVKFSGKHLLRTHGIPLENIVTEIRLKDRVLSLSPLQFGLAGGQVTSQISLDGRTPQIAAQINLAARHLKLHELVPDLKSMEKSLGEINGDASMTGHGNSISAMLATSNGELAATVSPGTVSRYLLELAGLNVANVLFIQLFGDKQVKLNCLVSDFAVGNGVAKVRRFIADTDDAVINVTGNIDLAQEQLDLTVTPNSKGIRIFSLRSPLYAKGTFQQPDVGVYKGPLLLKAAAAALLTAVAPPAGVLATVNMNTAPVIDCPSELEKALKTRNVAQLKIK